MSAAHGGLKSDKGQAAYYRMQWEASQDALSACLTEHRELVEAVRAMTFASDDGSEYEHNEGCQGEPDCPACWAKTLRAALAGREVAS